MLSHLIAPKYEALSKKYTDVTFVKCDVDVANDVAQKYEITAMPTFVLLKGKDEFKRIRGANPPALEQAIDSLSKEIGSHAGSTFPGQGQTLGSS